MPRFYAIPFFADVTEFICGSVLLRNTAKIFASIKSATCLGCDNAYKTRSHRLQKLSFRCDKTYN